MKVIEGLKWVLKFESFLRWVGLSFRDQHTLTLCWNLFNHVIGYGSYGFSNCFISSADKPLAFDFILFLHECFASMIVKKSWLKELLSSYCIGFLGFFLFFVLV